MQNVIDQMEVQEFKKRNWKILGIINIPSPSYHKLDSIYDVLKNDDRGTYKDYIYSVNFLVQEKYINIRNSASHKYEDLADCDDYSELEANLSSKGTRLLKGNIIDDMVTG